MVVFRVDANSQMGTGHLVRCCSLAKQLSSQHIKSLFLITEPPESIQKKITNSNSDFKTIENKNSVISGHQWEKDADQTIQILQTIGEKPHLVVDHYDLDIRWEKKIRTFVKSIFVIDDLANREHDCDAILDQNYYLNMDSRYDNLIPKHAQKYWGPSFVLFRDEFRDLCRNKVRKIGDCEAIVIAFGGSDPCGLTLRIVNIFMEEGLSNVFLHIIVGGLNPDKDLIQKKCEDRGKSKFYCDTNEISKIIEKCDLAIIPGGTTLWETLLLGIPTLVIVAAKNQLETLEACAKRKAVKFLGWHDQLSDEYILKEIKLTILNLTERVQLREEGWKLVKNPNTTEILNFLSKDERYYEQK